MAALGLRLFHCQSVDSICRLCFMERDQLELIFDADREDCSQWIEKLTSLKIDNVPNAPSSLCADCKTTLEAFDAFREMCITNDLVFKETFAGKSIPEELPAANGIKVESIEEQHEDVVIIQDGNTSASSEIPGVQDSIDTPVTKLVVDNFEIKVHDMDSSVPDDVPVMAMVNIPITNGEEIESPLTENHAAMNIAGHKIDIDSSVESDDSDVEIQDNSAQIFANENIDVSLTVEQMFADNQKYVCKICKIHVSKLHTITHLDVRMFRCCVCLKDFERFNYLSKHISKWHRGNNDKVLISDNNVNIGESNRVVAGSSTVALGGYEFIISEKDDIQRDKIEVETQKATTSSRNNPAIPDQNAYECKICKKYATKRHAFTHKAEGVFQCYVCWKTFGNMKNCSKHIKCHAEKQRNAPSYEPSNNVHLTHNCKICKKVATKMHVMTHKARGLYVCYICKKKYETLKEVHQHVIYHIKRRRKQERQDSNCESQSGNGSNKRQAPFEYTCSVCMKHATRMHATTHIDIGIFECHICSRRFDKFDYVSRHIKLHIKKGHKNAKTYVRQVKPALPSYQVDEPTASGITNSTNYASSRENYVDVDASKVEQTDQDIIIEEAPVVHIDIDSSVEDEDDDVQVVEDSNKFEFNTLMYTCNTCHSTASKLHVTTHKAEGIFQCPICPKVANRFCNMNRHVRTHNGK